jgi:tetratricopeptide (TPR) repeat protein
MALDNSRYTLEGAGLTLGLCGEKAGLPLTMEASRKYPQDTMQIYSWEPQVRAMLAMKEGRPQEALAQLDKGRQYEAASAGAYMRGLSYLQLKDAIAAFKDATKYRGAAFWAYYYPIPYAQSWLGMGRAYVMAGDKANAKKAYERFFTEWKDADADLPQLAEAKQEYAAL